ncbi:MAG: sigma-70 family RNA polymerase sigma factor [Prevotella sp.]|nr:sigma-70 family RNA polymerase sigma factor [Prevotella sp.]
MNNYELISNYYAQHRDEIVNFITVRIADANEAQDKVQDIFLHLLRRHQLITQQTLPCLVYTMACHKVADYYRRRRVYEEYEHYLASSDSTVEMESIISAHLLMERLERSLLRLPKTCSRIYRLHIYDGMKVSEIAQTLALPYKKVENRLGQARKHVREQLRLCAG